MSGADPVCLYHHPEALPLARRWAAWFSLRCCEAPPEGAPRPFLWASPERLELYVNDAGARRRGLSVDVAELDRRAARGAGLLRACGVSGRTRPRVLDAMAGWGVDGLMLAGRGCEVVLVERQVVLVALQQDLLRRSGLAGAACRWGDGYLALEETDPVDVVYLDPMFPVRRKGALPNRRMQVLADLTEADPRPLEAWLERALAVARSRVVLKRRRRDPVVQTPDWQIVGRTVRYDVFRGAAG